MLINERRCSQYRYISSSIDAATNASMEYIVMHWTDLYIPNLVKNVMSSAPLFNIEEITLYHFILASKGVTVVTLAF